MNHARPAGGVRRVCALAAGVLALAGGASAPAQLLPTAVRRATIFDGDKAIEDATLLVQGGKITAIGQKVDVPLLARKLSGRGKWVTPGLIDVWGRVAARLDEGSGEVLGSAADAFDAYARTEIEAALAQGVTAVYLPASCRDGVGGVGAVVRLMPEPQSDRVVASRAALHVALGIDPTQRPLQRARAAAQLKRAFQEAKDYRAAREDYEADLEEYEKKLKERAEGKSETGGEKHAGGPGGAARAADTETPAFGVNNAGDDDGLSDETKPDDPTQPRPRGRRPPAPSPEDLKRLEQLRGDARTGKSEAKDELKKPEEPPRDRRKERLLRAMDGELPVRVEAHLPEDILNALEIAEKFNLRLVIEGGSGAYLVAGKLAARDVAVVLGAPAVTMMYQGGARRYEVPDDARRLSDAGVRVYYGSGERGDAATLAVHAALRAARGADGAVCLHALTGGAAELLGVEKRIGRLDEGLAADFVVWSDHPLSPGARVERVFIDGTEVYTAPAAGEDEK